MERGTHIIDRIDRTTDKATPVGALYVNEDTPDMRAWLIKELLMHAGRTANKMILTVAIERNTGIEVDIFPTENDGPVVRLRAAGELFDFRARPEATEVEASEDVEDDDDDTDDEPVLVEAAAAQTSKPIDGAAFCGCGHKGSNHQNEDGDIFCRVCGEYTRECQKLAA